MGEEAGINEVHPKPTALQFRIALVAGIVAFVGLQLLFTAWVHYVFEGKFHGPFLASERFGITGAEAAMGYDAVVPIGQPHNGWDGQFYFRAAIDPFALGDAPAHIDHIVYRYQRIGVALVAWSASKILGYAVTSPRIYHTVQIALVSIGFAILVLWLLEQGVSGWYALVWLGAGGTLYTLAYGQPDSSADGMFIVSLYGLWHRRLGWYIVSTTLLLLIREGYAAYALSVFAMTAINRLQWGDRRYLMRCIWVALPGAVLVAWMGYLYFHFGREVFQATRYLEGVLDLPFRAFWQRLQEGVASPHPDELRYKVFSAFTLLVIFLLMLRRLRSSVIFPAVLPYMVLMTCLGPVVWGDQSGYLKALGSVLIVGIFLLPFEKGLLLRFVLTANLLIGIEWNFVRSLLPAPFYSSHGPVILHNSPFAATPFNEGASDLRWGIPPRPNEPTHTTRINDFKYEVAWLDASPDVTTAYQGFWRRVHREMVPFRLAITNRSSEVWHPNPPVNSNAVNVIYLLTNSDGTKVILDGRMPLEGSIAPGETREQTLWLRLDKPRGYQLRLAVIQEGHHWIDLRSGSGTRHDFRGH